MKTITIGKWYAELKTQQEKNENWERIKEECLSTIGVDSLQGNPPWIVIEHDGSFFQIQADFQGNLGLFATHIEHTPKHKDGDVICSRCGGMAFNIVYGKYEAIGTCINCGATDEVWSW